MTVNNFRKSSSEDEVISLSKALIKSWKKLLPGETTNASELFLNFIIYFIAISIFLLSCMYFHLISISINFMQLAKFCKVLTI